MQLIEEIDIGDEVACDFCNGDSDESGGVLVGSYAICPNCAVKLEHPEEIDDRCPPGMSFHDWVLSLRNGDNTIKIYG